MSEQSNAYGRVDEQGNVYVTTSAGERMVGQYPDSTPEEALAFFVRKFDDFDASVRLLEQRVRSGAPAKSLSAALTKLQQELPTLAAVGDLDGLAKRLERLQEQVASTVQEQHAADAAAVEKAVAERTRIVEEMEQLASKAPAQVRWKDNLDRQIFARWQAHQKSAPRLPKATADALWKRLRDARKTVEANRRQFFAGLDEAHREARSHKEQIIAEALKLADRREPAVREYRDLLDRWKAAGRAGSKTDDQLWARFKAAGDAIFAKKHEQDAVVHAEERENLTKKQALLERAEALLPVTDAKAARSALRHIEEEWDGIGRVPRESMRSVEQRLQVVEDAVRSVEQRAWDAVADPHRQRAEGLAGQLEEAITELEAKAQAAQEAGDAEVAKSLQDEAATKRSWLAVLQK